MLDTKPWKDTFTFSSKFCQGRLSKCKSKVDGHPGGNSGKRVRVAPHRPVAPSDSRLKVRQSMRRTRTRSMSNPVRTVLIRVSDFAADDPVSGSRVQSRSVSIKNGAAAGSDKRRLNFSLERSRTRVNELPHIYIYQHRGSHLGKAFSRMRAGWPRPSVSRIVWCKSCATHRKHQLH